MKVTVKPGFGKGKAAAPPSKSMAQRYLICAALCEGAAGIENIAFSDDVKAALRCVKALGAEVKTEKNTVFVTGKINPEDGAVLDCSSSGATLRFLIPVALLFNREIIFTGTQQLFSRPLGVYKKICADCKADFELGEDSLKIKGRLRPGRYEIPGDVSSQFVSGLLFALPLLEKPSEIVFKTPAQSKSYIDMTLSALHRFGISAGWSGGNKIAVPGMQKYSVTDAAVPGDYSNAAFFAALNSLGSEIEITGLDPLDLQGDRAYEKYLPLLCSGCPQIDISDCPDLAPVLFAVAAAKNGGVFTGTRRLALKECDRAEAMKAELSKFGAEIKIGENSVTVPGGALRPPKEELFGWNDHRIVMALAVLCTFTGGKIAGAEAVAKSFPDFFERMSELGFNVESGEEL